MTLIASLREDLSGLVRPNLTRELVANSLPEAALSGDDEDGIACEDRRTIRESPTLAGSALIRAANGFCEVTHEALLRKWPRLLQWLDDSRIELLQRQRIGMAAAQWREQGRDQAHFGPESC
jgi:hypothetical protein